MRLSPSRPQVGEIGFEAVFTKTYTAKLLTGLAFGGIT
jgi:hypothetical protein